MLADRSLARFVARARNPTFIRAVVVLLLTLLLSGGLTSLVGGTNSIGLSQYQGATPPRIAQNGAALGVASYVAATYTPGDGAFHDRGTGVSPSPSPTFVPALPTVATLSLANDTIFQGSVTMPALSFGVGIAYVPINHYYYVAGKSSGNLLAVDPATGRIAANISVGLRPSAVSYDPLNRLLYVTNQLTDRLVVVDPATNGVGTTIALPTGSGPVALAYDAATRNFYVADFANHSLSVVDPFSRVAIGLVQVGIGPDAVAVDAAGGRVFVANSGSDNVTIVNASTFKVIGSVGVGNVPSSMDFASTSRQVWVGNHNSSNITVLDARLGTSLKSLTLPRGSSPQSVVYDSGRDTMYVAGVGTYGVRVFNASTSAVDANVAANITAFALAYAPDRNEVAVLNTVTPGPANGSANITLVNDIAEASIGSVSLGAIPYLTVYDATTGFVYVSDLLAPTVYVIDQRTDQLVTTFALSQPASAMAIDPTGKTLWIGDRQDSNVLKLNATTGAVLSTTPLGFSGGVGGFLTVGNQVFVSGLAGLVVALDASNWGVQLATMPTGVYPTWMVADPPANAVYVMNSQGANVTVLRNSTDAVVGAVPLAGPPTGLAFDPLSGGRILVSLGSLGQVDVINGGTLSVGLTLSPFSTPGAIAYLPATQNLYVSDQGNSTLAVVNGTSLLTTGWAITGLSPGTFDFSAYSGKFYVSNLLGATVSILGAAPATGTPPFAAWATVLPAGAEVGQTMTIIVASTLRPWQLTYVFTQLPTGCGSANTAHLRCVPSVPGTFTTHIAVTGPTQTFSFTMAITVQPRVSVSIQAVPTQLTLGASTAISLSTVNATGATHSGWLKVAPGCQPAAHAATFACVPTLAGAFTFEALVIDGQKAWSETNLTLTVNPVPGITSFVSSSNSTEKGTAITLTVTVSGGTSPFRYVYTGLPGGCASLNQSTLTCTPTQTGTFHVLVNVTDSNGFSNRSLLTLTVTTKSTSGSLLGLPILDWIILLILIIIVVVVLILVSRRRSASEPDGEESGDSQSAGEVTYGEAEPPTSSLPPMDVPPTPGPAPLPPEPVAPSPRPPPIATTPPPVVYVPPPVVRTPPPPAPSPVPPPAPPAAKAAAEVPRRVAAAAPQAKVRSAAPAGGPTPGSARAALKCPNCGTMNEPWLTNCRWCKRPLAST